MPTPANSLDISSTGLVKFDGTATFSGVTVTQHDLLIGGASNAITSVAPSATSGVPVISQGASADPAFGTAVVAGGGTGATTLTGVLTGNGTSAITASTVTQHGILIGGASNAVGSTAVGSTGQVLQANSSADPTYSTATYPSTATSTGVILRADGTNWSATTATYPNTTTNNQLLYSSATNTISGLATANNGVLTTGTSGTPVITALGTDGQVIIGSSVGAPAAATLTAGTGISITNGHNTITVTATGTFTPNSTLQLFDDFTSTIDSGSQVLDGQLCWSSGQNPGNVSGFIPLNTTSNARPGIIQNNGATSRTDFLFLSGTSLSTTPVGCFILGGGTITMNWVMKINTLSSSTYELRFGFGDTSTGDQANGVYFDYTDTLNSGDWVGKTANASTRSSANSVVAADTNWHNFQITVNAGATSVGFFIDGSQIANSPLTTNIPTNAVSPFVTMTQIAGSTIPTGTLYIDLFYMTQTLTSTR